MSTTVSKILHKIYFLTGITEYYITENCTLHSAVNARISQNMDIHYYEMLKLFSRVDIPVAEKTCFKVNCV